MKAMDRREFLERVTRVSFAGTIALSALPGCTSWLGWRTEAPSNAQVDLDPAQQRIIASVQSIMLPAGLGFPSARDVHAAPYLLAALADPLVDHEVAMRIKNGCVRLDELAFEKYDVAFADLSSERQDERMRSFEHTPVGHAFLDSVLAFTLEALLGDPVHGGNPDQLGWRAFAHEPAFPRPAS